jgi:hypothetical protein
VARLTELADASGRQKVHVMESAVFTKGEKSYLAFYLGSCGGFSRALFEAIARADSVNLGRLAVSFPEEVQGFVAWTQGDLHDRALGVAQEVK